MIAINLYFSFPLPLFHIIWQMHPLPISTLNNIYCVRRTEIPLQVILRAQQFCGSSVLFCRKTDVCSMPNIPASISAVSAPAGNLQEFRRFIVSLYVIIIIFRVSSKSRCFFIFTYGCFSHCLSSYFGKIPCILHYSQSRQQGD